MLLTQSCLIPYDPVDYSSPGFSVHGILQARILEWVAIPFSRRFSQSRDWTWVSCIAGGFFTIWATNFSLYLNISRISHCFMKNSMISILLYFLLNWNVSFWNFHPIILKILLRLFLNVLGFNVLLVIKSLIYFLFIQW